MSRQMQVKCEPDAAGGRALLVRLGGHMDAIGATEVWDEVSPRVTADRPTLLLDLEDVAWISSAGVTTLINLLQHVKSRGGNLLVFGCTPAVSKVFSVVGLDTIVPVCESLEAARQRAR